MRFKVYIFVIMMFLVSDTFSQVTEEWVRSYSGPVDQGAEGLKVLTDNQNNVYVMGKCYINIGSNLRDFALMKYNPSGSQEWVAIYNGPEDWVDDPTDMAIDDNGNIFITGYTATNQLTHYTTIKYNSLGQQQWIATYYSPPNSQLVNDPRSIKLDNLGNVYVTGYSSTSSQSADYLTIKYNSLGQQQWVARLKESNYARDLAIDDLGNVYVTGYSLTGNSGYDIVTVKYNSSGQQQWIVSRDANNSNPTTWSCKVKIDNIGNIYVAASVKNGTNLDDFILIKYDPSGNLIWDKTYGDTYYDVCTDFEISSDGNSIYLIGYYYQNSEYVSKTLGYDTSGTLFMDIDYNGLGVADFPYDLQLDQQGNLYITGNTNIPGPNTTYDIFTVKYSPAGTKLWDITFNGANDGKDHSNSLAIDNYNNVYVTGKVVNSFYTMTTIKYAQSTGIQTISNELPGNFSLSQNYPNPFNPSTNIKFEIPKASHVKIVIHDALGREVSILSNERMNAGNYSASFDGANLNSGIYFYTLIADGFKETKKMILLK